MLKTKVGKLMHFYRLCKKNVINSQTANPQLTPEKLFLALLKNMHVRIKSCVSNMQGLTVNTFFC